MDRHDLEQRICDICNMASVATQLCGELTAYGDSIDERDDVSRTLTCVEMVEKPADELKAEFYREGTPTQLTG